MALTDHCDLYAAIHEEGANRVIRHILRQRPSYFNYATTDVALNRELWCSPVDYTPDVPRYGNPYFTVMDPLPLVGADSPPVALDFCAQLTKAQIDFHPGNTFTLPGELGPPLREQHFALAFQVCGAVACPTQTQIDHVPVPPPEQHAKDPKHNGPPVVLHGKLNCFCLDVFAIGHFERSFIAGTEALVGKVDDMDIVDIKPNALEDNIICYIRSTVSVVLREKLVIPIEKLTLSFPLFNLATVTLSPTPNPPVPNNPAVEEDQLKIFITMTVS